MSVVKNLKVKDLIELLKQYPEDMPLIITYTAKDHQYSVKDIHIY